MLEALRADISSATHTPHRKLLPPPTSVPPSGSYSYYPGTLEVPERIAANVHGNSYKVLADVTVTEFVIVAPNCVSAPTVAVIVMVALVTGWSKSTCSHCPTADCSALDTQLVDESPSVADVGPVAGATLGSAVESAAELDTVIRPPVQSPYTVRLSPAG